MSKHKGLRLSPSQLALVRLIGGHPEWYRHSKPRITEATWGSLYKRSLIQDINGNPCGIRQAVWLTGRGLAAYCNEAAGRLA